MKAVKLLYIILIVLLPVSCFVSKKQINRDQDKANSLLETQYYKLFTDATKHALFGNYKNAITLYNTCISIFPERAAPYYQISTIYLKEKDLEQAKYYTELAVSNDSLNIWYLFRLAEIYQYVNDLEQAIILYEKILKIEDDDEIRYNLAMIYSKLGKHSDALRVLNFMNEENQESREVILFKHNIYHANKEYDSAIYELELITKYFPDDITSYGMLAEYLSEIGRNQYAQEVYLDILDKEPASGVALLSYGDFFLNENDMDSALIYFKKAFCCSDLTFNEKMSIIIGYINDIDFSRDNYNWIEELLNAVDKNERKFSYYAALADLYTNLEKYEHAKPFLDSALIYEKNNFLLWEQSLIINSYLEENEDVINIATECLDYFNNEPNIYLFRASAYYRLNNDQKALEDTKKILRRNADKNTVIQAYNLAAEIYRRNNELEKSDSCYESILQIEPENLVIRNNYAYYLSLRKYNLGKAVELSKLTIEIEPNNPIYLDTYGWILYMMGKYDEAKYYIEYAIRKGAYNNAEVLEHYGDIMLKLDNCKEALEAYEQALAISDSESLNRKIKNLKTDCK